MDRSCVLAIDIGTSAVRAAVVDREGAVLDASRVGRVEAADGSTFDAERLWADVQAAVQSLGTSTRDAIAGIAIAGHVGTVFVDDAIIPVAESGGWSDSRGAQEFADLVSGSAVDHRTITGRPTVTPGAAGAWLLLGSAAPEWKSRVAHVLQPKDFVVARLTGGIATDATSAAYTGLSDIRVSGWSTELAELVGMPLEVLPQQLSATDVVATVLPAVAQRLRLPADCVVVAGGPDGSVGAALALSSERDAIADIAGTTDVLVRRIPAPASAPDGAVVNPFPLGDWSAGGPTGMTGGALEKWSTLLGFATVADALDLLQASARRPVPGSGGLSISPSLSGSRFPRWSAQDRGHLVGLDATHEPADLIHAALEGCAFIVREGVDVLDPSVQAPVVLAGGAARSDLVTQLRADVLNRPIHVSTEPDVSLYGAALIASIGVWGAGHLSSIRPREHRVVHPDPARAAAYEREFERWQGSFRRA